MTALGMSPGKAEQYVSAVEGNLAVASMVEDIPFDAPTVPEREWLRPASEDNPLGILVARIALRDHEALISDVDPVRGILCGDDQYAADACIRRHLRSPPVA